MQALRQNSFHKIDLPHPLSKEREKIVLSNLHQSEYVDELVQHNLRLVAYHVSQYSNYRNEQEDLFSIGCIGLIKAARTFDVTRNLKFATYAGSCITREMLMHLRKVRKHQHVGSIHDRLGLDLDGKEFTYEEVIPDETSDFDEQLAKSSDNDYKKIILGTVLLKYNSKVQNTVLLYISGEYRQDQISRLTGISQSYASRIIKRVTENVQLTMQKLKRRNITIYQLCDEDTINAAKELINAGPQINLLDLEDDLGSSINSNPDIKQYQKKLGSLSNWLSFIPEDIKIDNYKPFVKSIITSVREKRPVIRISRIGMSFNLGFIDFTGIDIGTKLDLFIDRVEEQKAIITLKVTEEGEFTVVPGQINSVRIGDKILGRRLVNYGVVVAVPFTEIYYENNTVYVHVSITQEVQE